MAGDDGRGWAEALAVLDRSGGALDAVLSDMMMPGGITGLDLVVETRRRAPVSASC
jgi:CheY-like chemotaxis protein